MLKKLFVFSSCFFASQTLYSQAQFAGFYVGEVFLKAITQGNESDEIKQGDVNLTIDAQGNIVSEGVVFLSGTVDNNGDIIFNFNGFFFETGKITNGKITATGTLENPGQTIVYRLAADQSVAPPEITLDPQDMNVIAGANITFRVRVRNAGTFQWRKDGEDIPGVTQSEFSIQSVSEQQAGTYSVVVTNLNGSATSGGAVLTVSPAGENPSWNEKSLRRLVASGDIIPGTDETFASFWTPVLAKNAAYFVHYKNFDNIGIYGYGSGGLFKIADQTDPSLLEGSTFVRFRLGQGPNAIEDEVIFYGESATGGLFKWTPDQLGTAETLFDFTAVAPDTGGLTIGSIHRPLSNNGKIIFSSTINNSPTFDAPLLFFENGQLAVAATQDEIVRGDPGLEGRSQFGTTYQNFDSNGDSFAILVQQPLTYRGVFASFSGGPLTRILDTTINFPDSEIAINTIHSVQVDGDWVYVSAQGASSSQGFLLRGNGLDLEVLISPDTTMPDGILGRIVSPAFGGELDVNDGLAVFTAGSNRGAYGVFTWQDGVLQWIFDRDNRWDGRAPQTYRIWPSTLKGDDLLVQVNFDFQGADAALYTTKLIGVEFFTELALGEIAVLQNGEIRLAVETPVGGSYKVQYSEDLSIWTDSQSTLPGTGLITIWTDTGPPETSSTRAESESRFYRLVEIP